MTWLCIRILGLSSAINNEIVDVIVIDLGAVIDGGIWNVTPHIVDNVRYYLPLSVSWFLRTWCLGAGTLVAPSRRLVISEYYFISIHPVFFSCQVITIIPIESPCISSWARAVLCLVEIQSWCSWWCRWCATSWPDYHRGVSWSFARGWRLILLCWGWCFILLWTPLVLLSSLYAHQYHWIRLTFKLLFNWEALMTLWLALAPGLSMISKAIGALFCWTSSGHLIAKDLVRFALGPPRY